MFNFFDLREEKQLEFISSNIAEILYRQRDEDKLSQELFLKNYFGYNRYTKKADYLSLSQLKRYEKNFLRKSSPIIPKKNSEIFNIVKKFSVLNNLYQEKLYHNYFKKDSLRFAEQLEELGLLNCIEKATSGLVAMNQYNVLFGKNYDKITLLDWLFNNAKKGLIGEDIPELIYEGTKTRHDINNTEV
ncbi:TPA: hypothetical protein VAN19_002038 [Streptococcus agalactiae]|nr:hypothetical protein [Streptococcus agalactiae]